MPSLRRAEVRRFRILVGTALAVAALTLVLLPAGASAATHAREGTLTPVNYGLPSAKEGETYRFSIAGAATGGVKPYHCAPAESFGPLWAWLHVGSNCVLSGTAPTLPAGTTRRITALRFKLTDSESPPKTVTLDPMTMQVLAKAFLHPFDGKYKVTGTGKTTIACPGDAPITRSATVTNYWTVTNDMLYGHKISVSAAGVFGSLTETLTVAGITNTYKLSFTAGAAGGVSVHGTDTLSGSPGGCTITGGGSDTGSRISP